MSDPNIELEITRAKIWIGKVLVTAIILLAFATLGASLYSKEFLNLTTVVVTAIIGAVSAAVGYFLGKQHSTSTPDDGDSTVPTAPPLAANTMK